MEPVGQALQPVDSGAGLLGHARQVVEQRADLVYQGRDDEGDGAAHDADADQKDERHGDRPRQARPLQPTHERVEHQG